VVQGPSTGRETSGGFSWNLPAVQALRLWSAGITGQGVVVANMDTGVDGEHPDLAAKWRGGTNSWFDPHGVYIQPHDTDGHGTQTMGIIVGGNTRDRPVGLAPDARWIAVKIFDDNGHALLSDIHRGFQWLLDPDGDPQTDDAPDVVNYSWSFPSHVNECFTEFQADIHLLKTAGIALVFAAGNQGPLPATSLSPANNPGAFAVGAVGPDLLVAAFSSRGPAPCHERRFPDMVAPGVDITTVDLSFGGRFDDLVTATGTSFAAAHVAGAMTLLLNAFPGTPVESLEQALRESALDLNVPGPDDHSGHGLLDLQNACGLLASPSPAGNDPDWSVPAGDINRDGHVDWSDHELFARQWSNAAVAADAPGFQADLNDDGRVDWSDFLLLQTHLFECPEPVDH